MSSSARSTQPPKSTPDFVRHLAESVADPVDYGAQDFDRSRSDPLAGWIESTIGLAEREGRLVRAKPRTLGGDEGIAAELAKAVDAAADKATGSIRTALISGSRVLDPVSRRPVFAFTLHQFVSRGSSAFATIEGEGDRS